MWTPAVDVLRVEGADEMGIWRDVEDAELGSSKGWRQGKDEDSDRLGLENGVIGWERLGLAVQG